MLKKFKKEDTFDIKLKWPKAIENIVKILCHPDFLFEFVVVLMTK